MAGGCGVPGVLLATGNWQLAAGSVVVGGEPCSSGRGAPNCKGAHVNWRRMSPVSELHLH